MIPSEWIWKNAEERAKKEHPLEVKPAPSPQDLLYAVMEYLDNTFQAAEQITTALTKTTKNKKGKSK